MGGGPKQFGIDAEEVPRSARGDRPARPCASRASTFSADRRTSRPRRSAKRSKRRSSSRFVWPNRLPRRYACSTSAAASAFRIFPARSRSTSRRSPRICASVVDAREAALPQAQLVIELGRYLVGEAGIYVCRVIDRKISRGQVFLVTDGGLHHHLAASGNFGQVIRKNYPVVIGNRVRGSRRETASVVGPVCTPLDLLADRMELAEAHPGDLVVVFQSGAYGATASPQGFLSHPTALEILA